MGGGLPDILFVIDTNPAAIAVTRQIRFVPVVAILDSNSRPTAIALPDPGNDDAMRATPNSIAIWFRALWLDGCIPNSRLSGSDVGALAMVP